MSVLLATSFLKKNYLTKALKYMCAHDQYDYYRHPFNPIYSAGLAIAMITQAFSGVSGAHANPAVTMAMILID